jgi:hypothetical protein
MVSQKDVVDCSHSLGEFAINRGPLASWVEDLAMAGDEIGF